MLQTYLPGLIIVGVIVCAILIFVWWRAGRRGLPATRQIQTKSVQSKSMNVPPDNAPLLIKFREALQDLNSRVQALEANRIPPAYTPEARVAVATVATSKPQLKEYSLGEALSQATTNEVRYNGNGNHPEERMPRTEGPTQGHNSRDYMEPGNDLRTKIVAILAKEPKKIGGIAGDLNLKPQNISKLLYRMFDAGIVGKNNKDEWILSGTNQN